MALKVTVEKYCGSRQLRPENLRPLRKGLALQLKTLMVKHEENAAPQSLIFKSDGATKSSSWIYRGPKGV